MKGGCCISAGSGALALQQRSTGGCPVTSWFIIPRLVMRLVRVPWPCFFFFCFVFFCPVTFSHLASLPLVVPSRGGTAGWFMPAFFPSCVPGSLRPVLFRPLVHMVWLFPGPLVGKLFLFFGLFASMVVSIFLPHAGRGTNLIKKAVNTSEKVSWVELLSLLPRLTFVGRLDWPSFNKCA